MILSVMAVLQLLRTMENFNHEGEKPLLDGGGAIGDEIPKVKELQSRVKDILWNEHAKTESTMLRWLRFNKLNVDKAEAGMRAHAKWRKEMDMDRLRVEPPDPEMWKRFFFNVTGYTRKGEPVMCIPYGDWDIRGYVEKVGNRLKFDQHQGSMWEKGLYAAEMNTNKKKTNDLVRYMIICDLNTLEYRQLSSLQTLPYIFSMVYNFENNFPETLTQCVLINCDWVFDILFSFMKPLMQGSVQKMIVQPKNRVKWEKYVRRLVDPIHLPYRYGGYSKEERKKLKLPPRSDD